MPRRPRAAVHTPRYHVLNRAIARHRLVDPAGDYAAFERALAEAQPRRPGVDPLTRKKTAPVQ